MRRRTAIALGLLLGTFAVTFTLLRFRSGRDNDSIAANKSSANPASPPLERLVALPVHRSLGTLYTRPWGSPEKTKWERLGPARGNVFVPAGREVALTAKGEDLRALAEIKNIDLHTLWVGGIWVEAQTTENSFDPVLAFVDYGSTIHDRDLSHLKRLRSLKFLYLEGTYVSPRGLSKLRKWLPDCDISTSPLRSTPTPLPASEQRPIS